MIVCTTIMFLAAAVICLLLLLRPLLKVSSPCIVINRATSLEATGFTYSGGFVAEA